MSKFIRCKLRKFFWVILCSIIVFILVMIVWLLYPILVPDGGFQTSLDPAFLPTAEFLIHHPMPTPEFVSYINPEPGSTLDETTKFCVGVIPHDIPGVAAVRELSSEDFPSYSAAFGARVIMNNLMLPRASVDNFMFGMMIPFNGRLWVQVETCTTPPLEKGLHLIEILIEDQQQIFTYTWAYKTAANFAVLSEN